MTPAWTTTPTTATIPVGDWIEIQLDKFIVPRGFMIYGGYNSSGNVQLGSLPGSWNFYGKDTNGDLYLLHERKIINRIREREIGSVKTDPNYVEDSEKLDNN